jgi:hypothetical protein
VNQVTLVGIEGRMEGVEAARDGVRVSASDPAKQVDFCCRVIG